MAFVTELLGTAVFLMTGGLVPNPVVNGMAVTVLVYTAIDLTGGHFNPAVTLCACLVGHVTVRRAIVYVLAQAIGAGVGIMGASAILDTILPCMMPPVSLMSVAVEAIGTLPLMLACFAPSIHTPVRPFVIGIGLTVGSIVASTTGGSGFINPAKVVFSSILSCTSWTDMIGQALAPMICSTVTAFLISANQDAAPRPMSPPPPPA
jgi:glycerol uptake facilitator-like aquaporin